MGRDRKLTRSLLPGALGAENKEKEIAGEKEKEGRQRGKGGGIEEITSHVGDRLVRATRHFVRLFRQSRRFIYLTITNLSRKSNANLLRENFSETREAVESKISKRDMNCSSLF